MANNANSGKRRGLLPRQKGEAIAEAADVGTPRDPKALRPQEDDEAPFGSHTVPLSAAPGSHSRAASVASSSALDSYVKMRNTKKLRGTR